MHSRNDADLNKNSACELAPGKNKHGKKLSLHGFPPPFTPVRPLCRNRAKSSDATLRRRAEHVPKSDALRPYLHENPLKTNKKNIFVPGDSPRFSPFFWKDGPRGRIVGLKQRARFARFVAPATRREKRHRRLFPARIRPGSFRKRLESRGAEAALFSSSPHCSVCMAS